MQGSEKGSVYRQPARRVWTAQKRRTNTIPLLTTAISGILASPRQLDKMRQQYWGRTARRSRYPQYAANLLARPAVNQVAPIVYTLDLTGNL